MPDAADYSSSEIAPNPSEAKYHIEQAIHLCRIFAKVSSARGDAKSDVAWQGVVVMLMQTRTALHEAHRQQTWKPSPGMPYCPTCKR